MDNLFKPLHKHMHIRPLTKSAGIILFLIGWEEAEILSTNHEAKQNQQ